jgi:hypothetical protein
MARYAIMARAKPNLDWMKTVLGNLEDRGPVDAPDAGKPADTPDAGDPLGAADAGDTTDATADAPTLHPPGDEQGETADPTSANQKAHSE